MLIDSLNNVFKKLFNDQNSLLTLDEASDLVSEATKFYALLLKDKNSPENGLKHTDRTKFKEYKKKFGPEILPLVHIATYLKSRHDEPEKILFCPKNQEYDGVFYWRDKEERLELVRALGGDSGGHNEGLVQELLDEVGVAPLGQPINCSGNKNKRQFGKNDPHIRVDLHKTDIPDRLELALKYKIKKALESKNPQKYKKHWLIITVPLYWDEDTFHEACAIFWERMRKTRSPFSRVFVITEESIKTGDIFSINCDEFFYGLPARIKKRNLAQSIWDSWNDEHIIHFLLRLQNLEFDSESGQDLYNLLCKVPDDILIKNLNYIAKWLLQVSQNMKEDSESKFLDLFDRIIQCASKISIKGRLNSSINEAFNHPIGDLTRSILLLLDQNLKMNNQISQEIQLRLTDLVGDSNQNQLISLIIAVLNIGWLFKIDKEWVKTYLLKHFKWIPSNQGFQYIWQAFIHRIYSKNPSLSHELFSELKHDFLQAIKHLKQKESHQSLCYILIYLFFQEDNYFDQKDFSKEFLIEFDIENLEHISFAIFQLLDSAGEKSHELWTSKINRWLKTNWPQGEQFVTPTLSDNFVRAAITARAAFGAAIKTLSSQGMLTISNDIGFLLYVISHLDSLLSEFFPEESLEVLYKVLPIENMVGILTSYKLRDIKKCLAIITTSQPYLLEDLRYKTINESIETVLEQYSLNKALFS